MYLWSFRDIDLLGRPWERFTIPKSHQEVKKEPRYHWHPDNLSRNGILIGIGGLVSNKNLSVPKKYECLCRCRHSYIRSTYSDDATVSGYHVPRDSIIFFPTWAIHRSEENYPNALEFLPERWDPSSGVLTQIMIAAGLGESPLDSLLGSGILEHKF